jgi:predicted RNA binding protein YcfA (HicA-like mRNA interferase family)
MKTSELLDVLHAAGWQLVRQKGSHRQFRHPGLPGKVTVAGKLSMEMPPGALRSILGQAGLKR